MLPATTSSIMYIDVSDVVLHAALHNRVSGIQRVVLNAVCHLVKTYPQCNVICIFHDQHLGKTMACRPADLLGSEPEFDADAMQYRLHQDSDGRIFPAKRAVKKYLNAHGYKRLHRFLKKCQIKLAAIVAPRYLERLGIRVPQRVRDTNQRAILTPIRFLDPRAQLVLLGATWASGEIIAMADRHRRQGGSVVQMVHDLIPYLRPDYCHAKFAKTFSAWLYQAASYSTKFICVSEYTANELRDFLAEKQPAMPDIQVVPLAHEFPGLPRNSRDINDVSLVAGIDRSFVLFVGTIEPRKNCMALLRTWCELQQQLADSTPILVIAGKQGWSGDEVRNHLSTDPKLRAVVRLVDSPSDVQIAWLYANCLFTIFPSMYEGWGLPVGEAAWFGKFTLASSRSSVPEVLGNLVDYVDPEDQTELLEKTLFLIQNPDYLRRKMQLIRNAPLRSWKDTTAQLVAVLKQGMAAEFHEHIMPRRRVSAGTPVPEMSRQHPAFRAGV